MIRVRFSIQNSLKVFSVLWMWIYGTSSGKINDTILNILGGVRSSCTYVGAPSLKQLSKCTTFVRVSNQFNDSLIK